MKTKKPESKSNVVTWAVVGASLAGVAATAYFFLGPKGKKHQQHVKAWAVKMKADVIEKLETAREMSEPVYNKIIDTVSAKYEKSKKASIEEIQAVAMDLKKHWKSLSASVKPPKSGKK